MQIIQLNVSPLTKKIMLKRYAGQEPFKINRRDDYNHYLQFQPFRLNVLAVKKVKNQLTEQVAIEVSHDLYKRLKHRPRRLKIGEYLHKVNQGVINEFVKAQVLTGETAMAALKTFFEINDIDEDDYSLEAAYKSWQRYKRDFLDKNEKNNLRFWRNTVLEKTAETQVNEEGHIILFEEVLKKVNNYFGCGFTNLLLKPFTVKLSNTYFKYHFDRIMSRKYCYQRQIMYYLLYNHSCLNSIEIASICNVSPQHVRYSVSKIDGERSIYDTVAFDIEQLEHLIKN